MQHLTVDQLKATYDAGAVLSVTLLGDGGGFELQIETRRGLAKLVKIRPKGEMRRFVDPRKALLMLREIGIREARIDSEKWRPEEHELERKPRPDRAQALKAAHVALSHSDWLREKLAASANDPRPRVPHEQVMAEVQALIDSKRQAHAPNPAD